MLEGLRLVVAPTTLLTVLLFYFGWVYTNARALYFGVDTSILGLSNQDYLLRSIDPIFVPLCLLIAVALGLMWVHAAIVSWIEYGTHPRLVPAIPPLAAVAGILLVLVGVAGVLERPPLGVDFVISPLGLGLGTGAVSYAVYVHRRLHPETSRAPNGQPRWLVSTSLMFVALLMILSVFWAMGDWAQALGRGRAQEVATGRTARPGVVVYSKERLNIHVPGVDATVLDGEDEAYRFRYGGFKLLIHSGGKYFLMPVSWEPGVPVVVLEESPAIRLELTSA